MQCTSESAGTVVGIPRISLLHKPDWTSLVTLSRHQFPVAPAFSLTINKAQGQSLAIVAVFLPQPLFGHSQLYIALSCITNLKGFSICMVQESQNPNKTSNVVNLEVIQTFNEQVLE
jgi:hypothetical protein